MKPRNILSRSVWLLILLVVVFSGCERINEPAPTNTPGMPEVEAPTDVTPDTGADTRADASSDTSLDTTPSSVTPASPEDAAALEEMQIIEQQVIDLRDLESTGPVAKAFLNSDELRQKMVEDISEEYSEQKARDDVLLYRAFDLIDSDIDLYNLLIDLYSEQVAGFYDPETKEMFVIKGDQAPGTMELWTYAHEYTHVLQDQQFDLEAMGFTNENNDDDEDSEKDFAVRSLVEGDATLLQQQYALKYFTRDDIQEILSQSAEIDTSVLDSAPEIVRQSLLFPYEAGLPFVVSLFNDGGWSAVDDAYANPPASTEQIIHPERYPDDVPQIVTLPPLTDTLGVGWRLVDEDVLGEFGLDQYLQVGTSEADAEVASEGWGGDRYAVHWRDDESAFVLVERLAWDTPADADEFLDAYGRFAEDRFGTGPTRSEGNSRSWWLGDDVLLLARNDQDETLIIIAPDEATLEAVHALFPDF